MKLLRNKECPQDLCAELERCGMFTRKSIFETDDFGDYLFALGDYQCTLMDARYWLNNQRGLFVSVFPLVVANELRFHYEVLFNKNFKKHDLDEYNIVGNSSHYYKDEDSALEDGIRCCIDLIKNHKLT